MGKSSRRVVVVSVDRLGAGFLGLYGNTWIETPAFNRLAAGAEVFENAVTTSGLLPDIFTSWWGRRFDHSEARLLTDDSKVAELSQIELFTGVQKLQHDPPRKPAEAIEQTQFAAFTAAVVDAIAELPPGCLLWAHSQGMAGLWDAPLEFRQSLADEDDPVPPDSITPPSILLDHDHDPDEVLGWTQAYGGQVMCLDVCMGILLDALETLPGEWRFIFTSPRGFPLGEHGVVGDASFPLHAELLHVPLIVCSSEGDDRTMRHHDLFSPADLLAIIEDDFRPSRDRVIARCHEESAIRTPAWFMRQRNGGTGSDLICQLYRKPDDRWEANDIAELSPEVVQLLQAELAAGEPDGTGKLLADVLVDGHE